MSGLGSLGQALIQAGAPRQGPRQGTLAGIAQALPAYGAGQQASMDKVLQDLLRKQQAQQMVAQQQAQQQTQQRQESALGRLRSVTQTVTPETALGMPGRVGPTADRAAMIGQRPQMTRDLALQFGLDPDLPEPLRKAMFDYAQATKPEEPKTPSSFQEFLLAQTNPQYREMLLERDKRKGVNIAMPKITIDMGNKFGDTLNKTLENIYDSGQKSRAVVPTVETMYVLLDEGIRTGFGQETFMKLNQAAQLFDPTFKAKEIAGQEAFIALSNEIILPQVKQLGVNPTDADLNFIRNGSPTLSKSVEGNKLLLDALKIKLQRDALLQEFATDWQSRNVSLLEQSPVRANSELRQAILNLTKTHPLYTQASQQLRERYSAIVGGQRSGVLPSNNPFISPR
jgi:hypothetical protein